MPATLRRTVAILIGAVHLVQVTGCAGWSAMHDTPGTVVARYPDKRLRVTRPDSTHVELRSASVAGDSLFGYRKATKADVPDSVVALGTERGVPVAVPFADIARLEVRKVQVLETTVLIVLVLGVVGFVVGEAIAMSNMELF
jgi:hypothetical protein